MTRSPSFLLIFITLSLTSLSARAEQCDEPTQKLAIKAILDVSATRYLLVHQFPNSRDSEYIGQILTAEYRCDVGRLSDYGSRILQERRESHDTTLVPGGYGTAVSADDFWKGIESFCQLSCESQRTEAP